MPSYIMKFDTPDGPRYLEYSSIVDAPVTYGMTLADFRRYYRKAYGENGMRDLDDRLKRVEAKGTSSHIHDSVDDQLRCNRAGDSETTLTREQLVDYYVVRCGKGKQPKGNKP